MSIVVFEAYQGKEGIVNLHVVIAEKRFETEEEAVKLWKKLFRLGMVVRLVEKVEPDKIFECSKKTLVTGVL